MPIMKTASLFILTLLLTTQMPAQSIRDTVFDQVILINEKDVTTDGYDFLIDIPVRAQKEPVVIFNNDRRIPLDLLFERRSFLSGQDEIILITPDWQYYEGINEMQRKSPGLHIDPYRQNKLYHIKRDGSGYTADSISRAMDLQPFTLYYKKIELKENEVKYYYSDCYLPYNDKHLAEWKINIDSLNQQLQVNIYEGIYTKNAGIAQTSSYDCRHYTLSALTLEQKLPAIKAITEALRFKGNDHLKDWSPFPKIYLPDTVIKKL